MKTYLALAWKELKVQKVTSLLILFAVILSTVATTAMGQAVGILQAMRVQQAAGLNGDRYATFHQLTKAQAQALAADDRLTQVGSLINLGGVKLGSSGLTMYLREYWGGALDAYPAIARLKEGRLPTAPGELALPEDALELLGLSGRLGEPLALPASVGLKNDDQPAYEYTADFVLTGILENNYLGYATGTVDAVVGAGTAAGLLPQRYLLYSTDFKTKNAAQFQAAATELAETLAVAEENIQYNWVLLDALGIAYDNRESADAAAGFSFMTAACVLVGALILFAAGLVIYNILKVSVARRIREYGTLRAMGGARGQLYRLVSLQLLFLCGLGIPLGLALGVFSAKGILTAATGLLNPSLFLADSAQSLHAAIAQSGSASVWPLLVSVAVTLLFAMAAAFPAARYAARVSPTVAMGGQAAHIKRRGRKPKRIRHFEAFYARLNLRRSPGRTAVTILSMVMSVTVFVALQSFSGLLDAGSAVQALHLGDYAVTNETVGLAPQAVQQLAGQKAVEQLATTKLSVYLQNEQGEYPVSLNFTPQSWESFQLAGVDEARLSSLAPGLAKQDLAELSQGAACLVKNPIPFAFNGQSVEHTALKAGDVIAVNGTSLRVAGLVNDPITINNEGFVNGIQVIVPDLVFDALTGQTRYAEVYPVLRQQADAEGFDQWLESWCEQNPGSHWLSYRQSDAQLADSFAQINLLCWGLILFIGLIGVLNIVNTVYTNLHTRVSEIGMQRAIGMSRAGLYKTFLWEGAYYGLIAACFGAVCGYLCTIFIGAAATDSLQLTAVPLVPILEAAAVSVAACLAATVIPLRAIAKMEIVASISAIE